MAQIIFKLKPVLIDGTTKLEFINKHLPFKNGLF